MKKLLVLLLIPIFLISCDIIKEPYESMEELETTYEIELASLATFSVETVYATHSKRLNDNQTLYYAPETVKIGEDIFLNKTYGYFIYDKSKVSFVDDGYEQIDKSQAKKLL